TGERFTWTLKTFINTLIRVSGSAPSPISAGGTADPMADTTPSAGLNTQLEPVGQTRSGSRKKYAHQALASTPIKPSGHQAQKSSAVTKANSARKTQPSRSRGVRNPLGKIGSFSSAGTEWVAA